jgi:hypothetical protein
MNALKPFKHPPDYSSEDLQWRLYLFEPGEMLVMKVSDHSMGLGELDFLHGTFPDII